MDTTLDGFVCGSRGDMETWGPKHLDGDAEQWILESLWNTSAHVMGAETYRGLASYWPDATESFAKPMNDIPKIVFSKSMRDDEVTWNGTTVIRGELQSEMTKLKREDGKPLVVHGGVRFARSLISRGLLDEIVLCRHPVAIGRGRGIFDDVRGTLELELIEARGFDSGLIAERFRVS